jgi:hypothetical protein
MKYAIEILKQKKADLEIEKRIWTRPEQAHIIRTIKREIKSLDKAIDVLTNTK